MWGWLVVDRSGNGSAFDHQRIYCHDLEKLESYTHAASPLSRGCSVYGHQNFGGAFLSQYIIRVPRNLKPRRHHVMSLGWLNSTTSNLIVHSYQYIRSFAVVAMLKGSEESH